MAITGPRSRAVVQHGLYEALLHVAKQQLEEGSFAKEEVSGAH
jgi:hypothetical protein